jgi:hypothetical protein
MAIARREVLGIGAALSLSAVTAACTGSGSRRGALARAREERAAAAVHSLPPPDGTMFYGASVPYGESVSTWEQELGASLAVHRSYFGAETDEPKELVAQCLADGAAGRLPHVSIKPAATWRDLASGTDDDWLASMLRPLGEDGSPVLFTLHHEPENDAGGPGMQPPDYVAMQERVIRLAAELAPRVQVTPVLQHWTFEPLRNDVDPSAWVVPGASVFGIDVYNAWAPGNGKSWRSLGSKLDEAAPWIGDRPIAIGEYGCRNDPRDPTLGAEWLEDAAAYARSHNVISMSYYNSGENSPDGSWALTGLMESTFADLLASPWVARPA